MFSSNVSRQFLKKISPFLNPAIARAFTSQKIIQQRKPIKHTRPNIKKSSTQKSSIKKHNVEPENYAKQRIAKIYNILKYSTWDSAKEQLENLSVKWDSYTVNQVLKTHPPMEKSWLFFNWAAGRKSFRHDQYTYTTMLDIFGEARRISSMMYVFNQMKEKGIKIDVVTYTSLMHWISNDGDVDGAIDLWKEMRAKGCRPTVVSYTAYMKILLDSKRVNVAAGVYKEMLESGLSPNCHTYTVLMEYLASSGKFSEAMEIFYKMQDAGVLPDKATCNILIEICCRTGEIWAMVKILEFMKENFLVLRNPVYQKALETFKASGESDALLRQVNRHFSAEYSDEDDAVLHNSEFGVENGLVLNFTNKQNLVAVDYLLTDMADKGVQLDSKVVSDIIEVNVARQRQDGALLAYDYSVKLGVDIERSAYLALIGFSMRVNSFHKVVEIVEKMVKQGLSLGTQLNSLLIHRLGCGREAAFAEKVFDLLPDKEKSSAEYTALIGAYFSCGNASKGLETFDVMKSKGVSVAVGTYCVVVAGLEKCGKPREVEHYRKEKKSLQMERCPTNISMEETICNLLFAGDFITRRAR
ncbi:pentatricopeptide repeat-containing protein At2g01390 [Salvia miltiorrhiza]|uniref:pentatricopeptide repeat-containing protein At2g01390 n=1 Tax=Salvia miltiorrhiza TaxID=226208 RepID=UPI0025ABBD42|nr:pentatricopeptide repeat-containing protein At2g01390 [Salvia miltiorrhiza]